MCFQNFVYLAFERYLFHVYYYWVKTWFLVQFLVKGHLKNIQRLQIALTLRAREIFGLWKVYSNLTPNFTRNHVSTNLCCYLQAVPYHLRLRTRFHIRFKRHARRVGQVRHLSMKICVLKHEQNLSWRLFTKTLLWTFLKALAFLRKSGPVDFARETDFVNSCVLQDSYVLIWKPQSAWLDLFVSRFFSAVKVYSNL